VCFVMVLYWEVRENGVWRRMLRSEKRFEVRNMASLNRNGRGVVNSEEIGMDGYELET